MCSKDQIIESIFMNTFWSVLLNGATWITLPLAKTYNRDVCIISWCDVIGSPASEANDIAATIICLVCQNLSFVFNHSIQKLNTSIVYFISSPLTKHQLIVHTLLFYTLAFSCWRFTYVLGQLILARMGLEGKSSATCERTPESCI